MQHINNAPLILTGNSTTAVNGTYGASLLNSDVIEVYNSDTTNMVFVLSGSSGIAATSSKNFVPPGAKKTFIKTNTDTTISIIYGTTSTAKVYINAGSSEQA